MGHPSDLLSRSDNGEAAGEDINRQVFGSTSDTVTPDDLLNCEGIRQMSVHRHETTSSPLSVESLHDMVSIAADTNATNNNKVSGSFDGIESIVIDVYSDASNVPSSLPRCGALEYRSKEILDLDPRLELQGSGSQGECTARTAIANEQVVGQSSKDNSKEPIEEDIMCAVVRSNLPDRVHSGKMRKNLSSDSKRAPRGFLQGSECIRSIQKLVSFHFISKWFRMPILDPESPWLQRWNKIFFLSCGIALTLDALFFYTPIYNYEKNCLALDEKLIISTSVLRSFTDIFYILHIIFQFRTGFIAPSSQVFGRSVLVKDHWAIAKRYLLSYFLVDILAVLPLPQVFSIGIPISTGPLDMKMKYFLKYAVLFQYFPRFIRMYPLYKKVKKTVPIRTGGVINFSLYMLASHIFGAFWYYLSVERANMCWQAACRSSTGCVISSLTCGSPNAGYNAFLHDVCSFNEQNAFDFGIYLDLLQSGVGQTRFSLEKLFFCFWWGLQNLGSLGQNLKISSYIWEIFLAHSVCFFGLFLFTLLIVNVQMYLENNTIRLDEMRVKLRDVERWMSHCLLPKDLKERIRRHEQYKWQNPGGVDEETLLHGLPKDIRRDVKRHLCLALVRRVPMFDSMDDPLLDEMCDRLKRALHTENSYIIREDDRVHEMVFIVRGKLLSVSTNGGRSGFFNSEYLEPGDFFGEELLAWALDPNSSNLPSSTRTVKALTEVEAFALMADDWKWIASNFKRMHKKQIQHTFRFYSQQWRTWAACFIQDAWRRYSKKKKLEESLRDEAARLDALSKSGGSLRSLGAIIYTSRFAANALRAIRRYRSRKSRLQERLPLMLLQKPAEPYFSSEDL